MGGQTLTKIFKQKRARGEVLEKLKNSSPSQPVVKRPMTRRSQVVNSEQPQVKGIYTRFTLAKGVFTYYVRLFMGIFYLITYPNQILY